MEKTHLGYTKDRLTEFGAQFTAVEIEQQPELWLKTYSQILNSRPQIINFMERLINSNNTDIIFTGAGTSAFIGNSLRGIFNKNNNNVTRAIATTDIVTHPHYFLNREKPTLLVSFARSGDSPESIAAVQLADQLCKSLFHLIITCNADGKLAKSANKKNTMVIVLPPEANDKGLAMTSSFTSMLLAGILISKIKHLEALENDIELLTNYGQKIITQYAEDLRKTCELPFNRAVFLGSGPLLGCAEECHLKLQELTDGYVVSKFDSFLGFRHGPKAVINPSTLMSYFFSSDQYVYQYERDLLLAINEKEKSIFSIGVMEKDHEDIDVNLRIVLSANNNELIDPDLLPVVNTLIGQLTGFYKSLHLGLKPDNPSARGAITRVVQGVKIYPLMNNSRQ
ncbi:MAG TPA: SIS domain-containing protein [bacterium]|nr:SIS domain-containing protein [bacterium]HPN43570.1 SIS domain-containing protein [bacterium]